MRAHMESSTQNSMNRNAETHIIEENGSKINTAAGERRSVLKK